MISRAQKVLFTVLLAAAVAMGGLLWHLRDRAHRQLLVGQDTAPTKAPAVAAAQQATLLVANDDDGSLREQEYSLPLPGDPEAKARAVLGKLLDLYAAPDATHPVQGGADAVLQVFLLPAAAENDPSTDQNAPPVRSPSGTGPELAVVNLKGSFAASHPSGLETETLTVLSICGTLRANLPRVTQVRFLVDGAVRPSLAGHADLTRTYLTADAGPAELNQP